MAFKSRSQWVFLFTRMFCKENGKFGLFLSNKRNVSFLIDKNKFLYINYFSVLSTFNKAPIDSTENKMVCTMYCCNTVCMGSNQSSMGLKHYSHNRRSILKDKEIKNPEIIHKVFQDKRQRLKQAELKLRKSGKMILDDIKETKTKIKEKMEEVIEVRSFH